MSGFSDHLISLGPSLYWTLDASTGGTDLSGNSRTGTASGPTIGGHTATFPPIVGADASCTDLDGTDDKVTSTYNPYTNATTRTLLGWAYRDVSTAIHCLVSGSIVATAPMLWIASGSQDMVFRSDFSGGSVTWTGPWPGNTTWTFWTLVFDETANNASLYIDGALISTQTQSTAYNASPGNFQVGIRGATNNPWNGKVAHVGVFESALSAGDILALYDAAFAVAPQPVIPDTVSAPALA